MTNTTAGKGDLAVAITHVALAGGMQPGDCPQLLVANQRGGMAAPNPCKYSSAAPPRAG